MRNLIEEKEQFLKGIAAKIRDEQDRVFLFQRELELTHFWSPSLYAKVRILGQEERLKLVVGYQIDNLGEPENLVYGLIVDKDHSLADKYSTMNWDQFPYDHGDRKTQVLLCLSADQLKASSVEVLLTDKSPNAFAVAKLLHRQQVTGQAPKGNTSAISDRLPIFQAQEAQLAPQVDAEFYFLEESEARRFAEAKKLLAQDNGAAALEAANQEIKKIVLEKAQAQLPKSTATSRRDSRLSKFEKTVFSNYYEVVGKGETEALQLKADTVLDEVAIQAMGLRDNQGIGAQRKIIDDIEFAKSVLSTSRIIGLSCDEISGKMDVELRGIDSGRILHHTHSGDDSVVSFKTSNTLHAGKVTLNDFQLADSIFETQVADILAQTEGCFRPSEVGLQRIRENMEAQLKEKAAALLTSLHATAKEAAEAPKRPTPVPAEEQFTQISAATLLASALAAYSGKSKYRYSTLFSAPRSKFMRELVAYLTEKKETNLTLSVLATEMKKRMKISDKCCSLFVSADDRRGVDRADALDRAQKGHGVSGLDDGYRTDRAIKAVLARFGRSA